MKKKLASWVLSMIVIAAPAAARASTLDWPPWTKVSNLIKLDFTFTIKGIRINAMAFEWPNRSDVRNGHVTFGHIGPKGIWNGVNQSGRYTAVIAEDFVVNYWDGNELQRLHFDSKGQVTKEEGMSRQLVGIAIPLEKKEIVLLEPVVLDSNERFRTKMEYTLYIYLDKPLILPNGHRVKVIYLESQDQAQFGVLDSRGYWKSLDLHVPWKFETTSRLHEIHLSDGTEGYNLKIDYDNGILTTADSQKIPVRPAMATIDVQYQPSVDYMKYLKACRVLFAKKDP